MQAETSKWKEQKKRKKTLKQDAKEVRREDKGKRQREIWIKIINSQTFRK